MVKEESYGTIKESVFDVIHQTKGKVDYETVTAMVKEYFPKSRWQKTHWSWYRSRIKHGQFRDEFSEEERANLEKYNKSGIGKKTKQIKLRGRLKAKGENKVKRIGDAILKHVRFVIGELAGDDANFRFKLNRWVFSRLQQEEIKAKRPIKQELWDLGMRSCQSCGKKFKTLKGVEIHRKDSTKGYSVENCELLCRLCHQKPR